MPTCRKCGSSDVKWHTTAGKYFLINSDNSDHKCFVPAKKRPQEVKDQNQEYGERRVKELMPDPYVDDSDESWEAARENTIFSILARLNALEEKMRELTGEKQRYRVGNGYLAAKDAYINGDYDHESEFIDNSDIPF